MVMSQRERQLAVFMGAALVLALLYWLVWTPYSDWSSEIAKSQVDVAGRMNDANILFDRQRAMQKIWTEMQNGGLKADASQAESQALNAVLDLSKQAGVDLIGLKPERTLAQGKFQIIGFNVTGNGTMRQISQLAWALETTSIPVRVTEMDLIPRKEGSDDLQVRLSISTLCQLAPAEKGAAS